MKTTKRHSRAAAILAAVLFAILFAGCSDDSVNAPDPQPVSKAPALPDPSRLGIDLSFFDAGSAKAIGQENFFNAYLRGDRLRGHRPGVGPARHGVLARPEHRRQRNAAASARTMILSILVCYARLPTTETGARPTAFFGRDRDAISGLG